MQNNKKILLLDIFDKFLKSFFKLKFIVYEKVIEYKN